MKHHVKPSEQSERATVTVWPREKNEFEKS